MNSAWCVVINVRKYALLPLLRYMHKYVFIHREQCAYYTCSTFMYMSVARPANTYRQRHILIVRKSTRAKTIPSKKRN